MPTKASDFEAISLKVASPEQILEWSYGEVTKPETINYRTQKPEKDGLFDERIFGPVKDWECYCGKYKRIRYKGVVCDKCGVEVTRSIVRRERMGHIDLAVPVAHIWFLRGVPSKIGIVLDLSVQALERVIYFANYIITDVDDAAKNAALDQVAGEYKSKKKEIEDHFNRQITQIEKEKASALEAGAEKERTKIEKEFDSELEKKNKERDVTFEALNAAVDVARKELKELLPLRVITDAEYHDLSLKYGHVFRASIGAEAIRGILERVNLESLAKEIEQEVETAIMSKRRKLIRRLRVIKGMAKAGIKPEWTLITRLPVLPPDLRPMVPLDGGRFAASDLNDLYRRVINRNNRLKRLLEINAPEVITRNEKRMLQEAVDALIDNNARRGKAVNATTGQKRALKSLADMLKGKQGRFRQNLLGKRVDYSGRSVIVVGPHLKLHQCGLPKKMALELFKPFIIAKLIKYEFAYNVRSASKLIEQERPEVWDMLEEATKSSHVLLNRAPTLHRLGIQAFEPVLIEGKAIQIHPMVCAAFNADFDGDQMAVHVPLTEMARQEAKEIMLSSHNLLKPATGEPITTPTQDIVLGCYYMTGLRPGVKGENKMFSSTNEVLMAYDLGHIDIQAKIRVLLREGEVVETSAGRILFNRVLPKEMWFINKQMNKKELKNVISECLSRYGRERAAELIDDIKSTGFTFLTRSGLSWSMTDIDTPEGKPAILEDADRQVKEVQGFFKLGLLTDQERYNRIVEIWTVAKEKVTKLVSEGIDKYGPVWAMIDSGARGSIAQLTQVVGMKGLVQNPSGRLIEIPVRDSFKEGFNVLEYFISTHGTRKGLSDTALRTANAGYLTRRLVDVAQDVVILEEDCKTTMGFTITKDESDDIGMDFMRRFFGRVLAEKIVDETTGEVIAKKGDLVDEKIFAALKKATFSKGTVRSVLGCRLSRGVCRTCYGMDLGVNRPVELGQAVGIVAAQAIGEPGTQLTMRTFHTGGVASSADITQGLPRVEELFEVRPIKRPAIISAIAGVVSIKESDQGRSITVTSTEPFYDIFEVSAKYHELKVKDKEKVEEGQLIAVSKAGEKIVAAAAGTVKVDVTHVAVKRSAKVTREYQIPGDMAIWVTEGEQVARGAQLTDGHIDLRELFEVADPDVVQHYILSEVQKIYSAQGQDVSDKHIEIIIRQLMSKAKISDPGDTDFLPDEVTDRVTLEKQNEIFVAEGKVPATYKGQLLGVTKASLSTESFLSAASFQETARVLIDAAVMGKTDYLRGLKENVIIGKLIPAGTGFMPGEATREKKLRAIEAASEYEVERRAAPVISDAEVVAPIE